MDEKELDYEPSLMRRLAGLGPSYFIRSYDTLAFVISVFYVYSVTSGPFPKSTAESLLVTFATISASLFAIVLTGLAIITSFTDKLFVVAWKKVGEYDNIITVFQYNLYLPLIVLVMALGLRYVKYDGFLMLFLIGLFVYMVFSLVGLVNLISKYALQRGEFIKQSMETRATQQSSPEELSNEELAQILELLNDKSADD